MPVTKQVYTVTPTWTASSLASAFRSAFIDAGLMTEWFDSFANGSIEHRVLEIRYDNAKTYGKTYYWFAFTTTGVYVQLATGWNTSSDIPAGPSGVGTQYLDWLSTATNTINNHNQFMVVSSAAEFTITRYTSGVNTAYSWFVLRNGTAFRPLHIAPASVTLPAWIDLDRVMFHWIGTCAMRVAGFGDSAAVGFMQFPPVLRRSYVGAGLRGETDISQYGANGSSGSNPYANTDGPLGTNGCPATHYYQLPSRVNAQGRSARNAWEGNIIMNDFATGSGLPATVLPLGFNIVNPAYATDSIPVFSGLPTSLYVNTVLPSDFGIAPYFAAKTMTVFDKLIVSAGTNEWEMLRVQNTLGTAGVGNAGTGCSPMFLARVVGG